MKKRLTDAAIQKLKAPKAGQIEVFDEGYPGLALRVSKGGARAFVFCYRHGGKPNRLTLGRYGELSLADAREAWRGAREDLRQGVDPKHAATPVKSVSVGFSSVFEDWMKRDQEGNRSSAFVRRNVERDVLPDWKDRDVKTIGRADVLNVLDTIEDRGSPVMARLVHAHLHRLFTWAVGRGLVESNLLAAVPKPEKRPSRDRVLDDGEFAHDGELVKTWDAARAIGYPYGTAVQLLLLTGARREEIGQLKWSEVRDDKISLTRERKKNQEAHDIPLSPQALAILEGVPCINGSEYVFTVDGRQPITGWSQAKRKLDALSGVTGATIHDLRRTVATGLQTLKTPLEVTEAVLGHTSGSRGGIVGVYQRGKYAEDKRRALEAWANFLDQLLGRAAGANVVRLPA